MTALSATGSATGSVATALDVAVDPRCAAWSGALPAAGDICRRAAAAALTTADIAPEDVEISVVLADDAFVRDLNRQWRGKDTPTNVLAFPCADERGADGGVWLLGDVVVAFETALREAETEARRLDHHLTHLVVHGVLHLLGYDHISDDDADRMEKLEIAALDRLGIENPYSPSMPEARHPLQ
jgi:probable rRNA maturation factor